jgi:hypothetical protein
VNFAKCLYSRNSGITLINVYNVYLILEGTILLLLVHNLALAMSISRIITLSISEKSCKRVCMKSFQICVLFYGCTFILVDIHVI